MALPKPETTEADVHAVRACIAGSATSEQQIRAMRWIGEQCCHIFDSPYVADGSDRESFVMLGRHQVGVMISAMQTPRVLAEAQAFDKAKALGDTPKPKRGTTK